MGSPDFREQFTFVARQLDRFGLAYLHVIDGLAFGFHQLGEPMTLAEFRKEFMAARWATAATPKKRPKRRLPQGRRLDRIRSPLPQQPRPCGTFPERLAPGRPVPLADWYSPTGAKGYTDFPTYAPA